MRLTITGILAALAMTAASAGAGQAAPVPTPLKPLGVAGPGLNVRDLEAQKAWYSAKLGMQVLDTYLRDGKPHEYIMGYGPGAPILALLNSPQRPAGPNLMGRVILLTPNAKALADFLKGEGVASREVAPGVAYFIQDPEGNPIELYTPPAKK